MTKQLLLEDQPSVSSNTGGTEKVYRKQRRAHHKVKTGCKACKIRRQKCDESKPICSGCSRHSTECIYFVQKPARTELRSYPKTNIVTKIPLYTSSVQNVPLSPSSELNLGDLELLHQYLTSTCIPSTQRPEITAHIQMTVPLLAQAWPFVMRGILAQAATHLSRLRPSRQAHYAMVAAKHHSIATPEFRSALQNINETNCHALIVYSKSLLWSSFASCESSSTRTNAVDAGHNWLPDWFCLLRGSCHIVEASRPWIKEGPHVRHELDHTFDYSSSPHDDQILLLMSKLPSLTESKLCMTVLSTLRESFARASMLHHNNPARDAINLWVGQLPDEYMDLLQSKEPWALVALAYFCVLVQQTETFWFTKGRAVRLMLSILECLDNTWKRFVQWPCKELGIESGPSTSCVFEIEDFVPF